MIINKPAITIPAITIDHNGNQNLSANQSAKAIKISPKIRVNQFILFCSFQCHQCPLGFAALWLGAVD